MKKYVILILSFTILFLGCKEKKEEKAIVDNAKSDTLNVDLAEIKEIIKFQKNSNYVDYRPDNPYRPSEKDLIILIPFVEQELKKSGYKTISDNDFEKRIEALIKKNKIKNYSSFTTIFTNTFDRTSQTLNEFEFELDVNNQFAVKKYNFMIPMLFLEDVIKIKKDNSYSISVPHYIIARNKYLFNDSKEDLSWLLINDQDFLKDLVISLGYDSEPKINKLLLEDFYQMFNESQPSESQKIGTLIFTKDLNNNFCIRQGLVDYVRNNTKVDDNRFVYALSYYSFALYEKRLSDKFGSDSPFKMFNAVEKAHIVSVIASIEVPAIQKYKPENPELWNNAVSALYNLLVAHPEIEDIIIKNNYFGIKNMKQVLDDTLSEIHVNDIKRGVE